MSKDKRNPGSFPSKNGSKPFDQDPKEVSPVSGGDPGNDPKKKDSPNLFEEHIRQVKKEGD